MFAISDSSADVPRDRVPEQRAVRPDRDFHLRARMIEQIAKPLERPRIAERRALDRVYRGEVSLSGGPNRHVIRWRAHFGSPASDRPCAASHFTCASASRP